MCGISAIINKNFLSVDRSEIKSMNDKIIHRGPDNEGYYFENNFALGHRRLSIIDLTTNGDQPLTYLNKYVISYNGEIFNYIELREELIKLNYEFKTSTDTEVILCSYHHWKSDCVNKFNGMWAFVIYDKSKNILFGSRDRYGIKPFNYVSLQDKFLISSEIKQFYAIKGFEPKLNKREAYKYLLNSQLNSGNETLFEGVHVLPPGYNLTYNLNNNNCFIKQYYSLNKQQKLSNLNANDIKTKFSVLFKNAVKIRLRSDVKVGACLSGGLDSSSIVCQVKEINSTRLNTYSACFKEESINEEKFVDEVISKTGFESKKVFPEMDKLIDINLFNKIIYHQDQPILSCSHFAEYSVFEKANQDGLKVMLDGQGADEFLAGYMNFFFIYIRSLIKNGRFINAIQEIKCFSKNQNKNVVKTFLSAIKYSFNSSSSKNGLHIYFKNNFISKYSSIINSSINIQTESINEITKTSIPYQLHSEDRNSMMSSIESRLPFLDFDLCDFINSLPDQWKIRDGKTKFILREAMTGILPNSILNRHNKIGFAAPDELFVRNNAKYIRKQIENLCNNKSNLINKNILTYFDQFINKEAKYDPIFFRIYSFNTWMNVFNIS